MVNLNFREYILKTGEKIVAGKSAEQNDLLVSSAKRNDYLLHTVEPGSPFVNLGENPSEDDIKEASLFCALRSKF
jgi:predicted ribosome quality control (RQC) complex YloA/Tae2 family protein